MPQPEKPQKRRGQGAKRKSPVKARRSFLSKTSAEFRDDKFVPRFEGDTQFQQDMPGAPATPVERDFLRDFEEDRAPTSSTPLYDELPTPLRVPPKKLDTKSSGRGDGDAERLDLIRKEVIRNNSSIGKDGKFTSSISGKRYMNGGMVMSGRGVRDTKMS